MSVYNSLSTTVGEHLRAQGVSRRNFLKFCTLLASSLSLAPALVPKLAQALEQAKRPAVIWLSFQECTGCAEAITRSHSPNLENLIFDAISLDYQHTLQAAAGFGAESAREESMREHFGHYILIVDGSIPTGNSGYSTIAGLSNLDMLLEAAKGASAIIALGTCAAFGGLPKAQPNPTGAVGVADLIKDKPIINVPGCPPIPVVITGLIAHLLAFGLPELDQLGRPKVFYGQTIHDRCYRRPFYDRGLFADSFDDEGAKAGWCLYKLGCKGPVTYNACATTKWNDGVSFPIEAGHGCLGCSEPNFWDFGGFYRAMSMPTPIQGQHIIYAASATAALGVAAAALNRKTKQHAIETQQPITIEQLNEGASDD